jgi:hypothetical protein
MVLIGGMEQLLLPPAAADSDDMQLFNGIVCLLSLLHSPITPSILAIMLTAANK